jgi:CRP-like cAMP-binding protein
VFQNWEEYKLKPIATIIRWQQYPPNHIILGEGQPIKNFIFIRKGHCNVIKNYMNNSGELIELKIQTLKEYSYFGEEGN